MIYENERSKTTSINGSSNQRTCNDDPLLNKSDILQIYIYQPYLRIRYIRLNENSPISILETLYSSDSLYIFNGHILDKNYTFKDCNIKNENKIVLIPSYILDSKPEIIQKWINLTKDREKFESKIDFNLKIKSQSKLAQNQIIESKKLEIKRKLIGNSMKTETLNNPVFKSSGNNDCAP